MLKKILFEYWVVFRWVVRRLFSYTKTSAVSKEEYETKWDKGRGFLIGHPELYVRGGKLVLLRHLERSRAVVGRIHAELQKVDPQEVLEVGMGMGQNVIALALLNNDGTRSVRFQGIDLTDAGIRESAALLKDVPADVFTVITGLSAEEIARRTPLIQNAVTFTKRDMTDTGFPDATFDFVYSHIAIEQLPRNYGKAFTEICRILRPKGRGFFVEEFAEAQDSFLRMITIWAQDYFHASYTELPKFGFKVLNYEPAEYQKFRLGTGYLLVEKR